MNENQIADIWLLFKEYCDKKFIDSLAERYVDLLVDHGVGDKVLNDTLGHDEVLDQAIDYYFNQDDEDSVDDDGWDFDTENE
jgi:hypothetical protein